MSRYEQASHVFWRCQYHIVWTPKYRFKILKNNIGKDVYRFIHIYCDKLGVKVMELNVQIDHVHLVVKVPPKLSISRLIGCLKGRLALKLLVNIRIYGKIKHGVVSFGSEVISLIQ